MIRPRTILATAAVVLGALALSACTSSPQADPPGSAPPGGTSTLPDPTDSEAPVDNPSTPAGLEAVDLGLSVRWANMNVGAEAPTDHGSYFGWGDTTGTNASTNDDDFPFANPPASISGTEQDAAHVHWGDGWRMPTHDEQMELVEQCDWQSDPQGDVPGWTITCPNGNSIFLTAGGGKIGDQTQYDVVGADFWSGTLDPNDPGRAHVMWFFHSNHTADDSLPRHYRFAIRPVTE